MTDLYDDGLNFSGSVQPPTVPTDPVDDQWRGETGAAGATGATGATGLTGPPGDPATRRAGLIIPYYVYVANPYNDVAFSGLLTQIRSNPTVPVIVIVNQPGVDGLGGPGPLADAAVAQMIRMLQGSGAQVCGYVSTQNATRNPALVQADIVSWHTLYPATPLDGVFFDELPYAVGTGNANIALYRSYYDYAYAHGYTLVVGNPGTQQLSAWYDAHVADIYICYENTSWPPLSTFNINPPSYISGATTDYRREDFGVLVYNSAFNLSAFNTLKPWFGWLYATDNPSPASVGSPWAALPTYLTTMFTAASDGGAAVTSFNTRTGAVTLSSADVTGALTFTPYDAANPSGYQTAANVTTKLTAPGAIGGTTPGTGAFTTLSATSTISGAGFSTWLASPPAIGGTAAAAGTFNTLAVAGTAGSFRNVDFRSGASLRMRLSLNNTTEGGANAGSDLDLFTFTDAGGALLSPAIRVTRSTGAVQFFAPLTVTSLTASSTITPNQTAGIVGTNTNNNAQAGSVGEVISAVVLTGAAVALTTGTCVNVTSISLTAGDWDVTGTVGLNVGGTTVVQSVQTGISTTSATMPGFSTINGATQLIGASFATGFPVGLGTGTARLSLASTTTVYLLATVGFTTSTAAAYGAIWARRAR